jgi:hypothetical protein
MAAVPPQLVQGLSVGFMVASLLRFLRCSLITFPMAALAVGSRLGLSIVHHLILRPAPPPYLAHIPTAEKEEDAAVTPKWLVDKPRLASIDSDLAECRSEFARAIALDFSLRAY